jgi:hypothetical protein
MFNLSLEDATVDEKLAAKKELWSMLTGKPQLTNSAVETIDYADFNTAVFDIKTPHINETIKDSKKPLNDKDEQEIINSSSDEETNAAIIDESSDEEDIDLDTSDEEIDQGTSDEDSDENISSEDEDYEELGDTEEDELLEEDMLIMEDYMENIELEEGENLNDLLAWSAMQDGNLEVESDDDIYDYSTLDEPALREVPIMEEEEINFTKKKGKRAVNNVVEDTRKKVGHRIRDDNSVVDPEIFGQTLKAALADVPPGLRPGMRRWYEKQQRKEDKKKKKEEAKAHRKEKKQNGKGKAYDMNDEDFTNQMAKIDE